MQKQPNSPEHPPRRSFLGSGVPDKIYTILLLVSLTAEHFFMSYLVVMTVQILRDRPLDYGKESWVLFLIGAVMIGLTVFAFVKRRATPFAVKIVLTVLFSQTLVLLLFRGVFVPIFL